MFQSTKILLLFWSSLSLSAIKTLTFNIRKTRCSYDSFYLSQHLYESSLRFEMNSSITNFNKTLLIKNRVFKFFNKNFLKIFNKNTYYFSIYKIKKLQYSSKPDIFSLRKFALFKKTCPLSLSVKNDSNSSSVVLNLWNKNNHTLISSLNSSDLIKYLFISPQKIWTTLSFFNYLSNFYFYNFKNTNLLPASSFLYVIKKKIVKVFNFKKFNLSTTPWQYNTIIRFLEFCSGSKIFIKFFFYINFLLNEAEKLRCILWFQKLRTFQRSVGNGFFLYESIEIIYIALKIKDPFFLISWISRTLHKINFWKHRAFFHYLKYVFKYFFSELFEELSIKGIKFRLKGKISVSGNARTRKINCFIGKTGISTYDNKILHTLELIRTFTGVMGLQIWLIF